MDVRFRPAGRRSLVGEPCGGRVKFRFRRQSAAGQRQVVWLLSGTASVQTLLQAIDAGLQGSRSRTILWVAGASLIGICVGVSEKAKQRLDG